MKILPTLIWLVLIATSVFIGREWGQQEATQSVVIEQKTKKILYYRNPMGLPDTSSVPKKDSMGMDYIPVYENDAPSSPTAKKILYYRNPMGLPDTSPVPKKDSMGMDYIAVYEGENETNHPGQVVLSPEKIQKLGVRTEQTAMRDLVQVVRAVGILKEDERLLHTISLRFDGWIEQLMVNVTGQQVAKGDPLLAVYSPELLSTQEEYLIAARGSHVVAGNNKHAGGLGSLAAASLLRLHYWEIPEDQIDQLKKEGKPQRLMIIRSPFKGVVLEKKAESGMRFMAGEMLFRLADLTNLWMIAELFEKDLSLVEVGQAVRITVNAFPGRTFDGVVSFIYPTVNPETRTVQVRIELPNPQNVLKPAMYANLELQTAKRAGKVLTAHLSAVLQSGARNMVLVQLAEGRFEPREVRLGVQADPYVEILSGLGEGEAVVVSANFLIDAESNLKAAFSSFSAPSAVVSAPATDPTPVKPNHPSVAVSPAPAPVDPHAGHGLPTPQLPAAASGKQP